jgi:uncharacterized paraquat-inducible protein A
MSWRGGKAARCRRCALLIDAFSQLVGSVCVSAALAVVALLIAAWLRRYADGLFKAAADAADGE